jgi:hypothetical protein
MKTAIAVEVSNTQCFGALQRPNWVRSSLIDAVNFEAKLNQVRDRTLY